MFTIIGGDGQEYGPVTAEQLRTWIAAGRANLETMAKVAGSDEWRRLGDYPEFSDATITPPLLAPVAVAETDLADRGLRLLAKILDEVLALICALPGLAMLGWSFVRALFMQNQAVDFSDMAHSLPGLLVLGLGLVAITVVQIWLLSTRGQTIAKIVFGIRIVRIEDGAPPGFVRGWLLRNFVPGLIGFMPLGLGYVFAIVDACFIFRQDRRCIHDLIARTRVVKV